MSRISLVQYGNYSTPQAFTLAGASSPALILGQWWFDFSTITESNLMLFAGIEQRLVSGGSIVPHYGIFLLPDGDPNPSDLFSSIFPDLEVSPSPVVTTFHGYDATVTVANPGVAKQILLAVFPEAHGSQGTLPTDFEWRSLFLNAIGA